MTEAVELNHQSIHIYQIRKRLGTMTNLEKYYINGEWITPTSTVEIPVINPATEETIGRIFLANQDDVNQAIDAASQAFDDYATITVDDRLALLKRLLDISKARLPEIAQIISTEMGAPITMALSQQADAAVGHLEGFIEALSKQQSREVISNGDLVLREPIGVCGLITPWNWPINQIVLKVLPALATGNTCILKPSEFTPLSAVLYTEMLHEAGFPPGVFNMIQGDGPTAGATLSCSPKVDMMSFTGSTRAGISVSKDAAETVKRVTLELGGKSPNIVFADCDLEEKVKNSILHCFNNTGQSCDAPTRMLVERECYEKVIEIARKVGESVEVKDPKIEGQHLGPLVSDIQYQRVQSLIEVGIAEGAQLLIGGAGKPDGFETGYYCKPTIFVNVDNNMRIAQEEVFGPVLTITAFDTEAEAVEIANSTPYGLAAYVQTGNPQRAERIAAKLRAGSVHINGASAAYGSPFGGYKSSGNGREGGVAGLEDFQETKTLLIA